MTHSNLSTPYKEKIRQSLARHENDVRAHLLRGESIPKKILSDFDWQAMIVAGSSHLSSQETPLLRLSLTSQLHSGVAEPTPTSVEFSVPELESTISELHSCLGA